MNRFAPLLLAVALTGCATFDRREIASLRERNVAPAVLEKLDRGQPISPDDVIELSRRRVPEPWIIRQIEDHDVDSLVTRSDVAALRQARVSPPVIEALIKASDRFQEWYRYPDPLSPGWGYGDPWGFYDAYPYYGYGLGTSIAVPLRGHYGHHRR